VGLHTDTLDTRPRASWGPRGGKDSEPGEKVTWDVNTWRSGGILGSVPRRGVAYTGAWEVTRNMGKMLAIMLEVVQPLGV
jgi:hypothetical protein